MNNNLLYFPYINIPQNNWTIKSLLYWENVGIIVPPEYNQNPKSFDKRTIELLKSDLISPIIPSEYIHNIRDFETGFRELISFGEFDYEKRHKAFFDGKHKRIHVQKFGEGLLEYLRILNLAEHVPNNYSWYNVETKTANLIMHYLAIIISKTGNFTPCTDDVKNLDISIKQNGRILRRNSVKENLLQNLLPYPTNPDLSKLRRFKDRHHNELQSFRILLEKVAFDISVLKNKEEREVAFEVKSLEINDKREKILAELNQTKIGNIAFSSIIGLLGSITEYEKEIALAVVYTIGNAVYTGTKAINNIKNKDFSYLALIDKELK